MRVVALFDDAEMPFYIMPPMSPTAASCSGIHLVSLDGIIYQM